MDFSQIRGGVVFGMDIDALEQQREDEAPLRDAGRSFLASKSVKLSRTDLVAIVEGVLTEAVNQLINSHDLGDGEALGLLQHVLSDAYCAAFPFFPRTTEEKAMKTTFDAFKASVWTPEGSGQVLSFPDLFQYLGDEDFEAGEFVFNLKPAGDVFELTAYHTERNSHLDDFFDEVPTIETANEQIREILEQWEQNVDRANWEKAKREEEYDEEDCS